VLVEDHMRRFMLILQENPQDFPDVTPDEMRGMIERYNAWGDALASRDRLVQGLKLREEGGRKMRKRDKIEVSDGAYAEAKEVIGGVFVVRASDYDDAVALASDCPHLEYGTILVREIDEAGNDPAA